MSLCCSIFFFKSMEWLNCNSEMVQDRPCLEWFRDDPSFSFDCVGVRCAV